MELLRPLNDAAFAGQTASYTGTAGSTTGWPAGPQGVLVTCTTAAYVRVGEAVTATLLVSMALVAGGIVLVNRKTG